MKLLPCPCCGGTAQIKQSAAYCKPAVSVSCSKCGMRTAPIPATGFIVGDSGNFDKPATLEDAKATAIHRWNAREGAA